MWLILSQDPNWTPDKVLQACQLSKAERIFMVDSDPFHGNAPQVNIETAHMRARERYKTEW
jgi:hypothetical protein